MFIRGQASPFVYFVYFVVTFGLRTSDFFRISNFGLRKFPPFTIYDCLPEHKDHLDTPSTGCILFHMKAIAELAKDALELPPVQRLALARILLDLSEEKPDYSPAVAAAWEKEICRRMDEVKAGRARSSSYEAAFARLDRQFPT